MQQNTYQPPKSDAKIHFSEDGKGMCRRDGSIFVLHLQGSEKEMARQHGELLRPEIRLGVLPFMARFLRLHLEKKSSFFSRLSTKLKEICVDYLALSITKNMDPTERDAFHELGERAGISTKTVDLALGTPDTVIYLTSLVEKLAALGENQGLVGKKAMKLSRKLSSAFPRKRGMGCCGAVALPGATGDGHLLHGRNMDYDGMGFFDRFPTIAFCKPHDGQPFVWIASAGVHTAGLTAMNESGLFLGANTAPTTDVSINGLSLFSLNDRVIRKARSFSDGIDLLSGMKPATGYNIHLSHGPSNQAGVVEVSAESHAVRYPTDDLLAITNHYETKSLAETIPKFTIVDHYNSLSRRERLNQLLYEKRPEHTVQTIAGCLRDQREPDTRELHPLGDVLCNYMNVSSVIADVTQGRLYVGSQTAPTALGRYVDFDFHKEMDSFLSPRNYPIEEIAPSPTRTGTIGDSVREYISAHVELTHRRRTKEALGHLELCLEALPKEPRALLSAGLLSLHEGRLVDARGYATEYLETVPEGYPRRHRAYMLRAWCDDLSKNRVTARENRKNAQKAAQTCGDPTAETEVRRFGRKRFTERDRKKMDIDLFNAKNFPI